MKGKNGEKQGLEKRWRAKLDSVPLNQPTKNPKGKGSSTGKRRIVMEEKKKRKRPLQSGLK